MTLVVGYGNNGRDHGNILRRVLQICRDVNLILNRDNNLFKCSPVPFLVRLFQVKNEARS